MSHCGCKKTPCGCKSGGVGLATTGSCGCGGGGCVVCEPRSFIRPRFFAGQLLTDEDLALLGDYVVAKNRLHNRALWGPGVVCGLDVNCDPCGGGTVIVQPGYAINCCGDDIVVPCPESVDVLSLIKDLLKSSLGAECADPCDPPRPPRQPPPPPPPPPPPDGGPVILGPSPAAVGSAPDPKAPVRRYYLYIRYVEDLTDPVSPYATDEPCAGQACEPTRVREGHRYELRCENDNPHFLGLGDRIRHCIDDLAQARGAAADATVTGRVALRLASAQRALAQTPAPVFVAADFPALRTAATDLRTALASLSPAPTPGAAPTPDAPAPAPVEPGTVRTAVEALRVTGSLFARLVMTPVRQRPEDETGTAAEAQRTIATAMRVLPDALSSAGFSTLETAEARATLGLTGQFARLANPPAAIAYNQRLWALGAPLDDALVTEMRTGQSRILAYLGPRLVASPRASDCQLLAQFQGIRPIGEGPITESSVAALAQFGSLSAQVLARLLFECICDAFNPPCQGCDDPAVLLAEVCVQDCVVIDICQMVRRFVITWPSVRYWTDLPNFPLGLNAIGELIEAICCGVRGRGCAPTTGLGTGLTMLTSGSLASLVTTRLAPATLARGRDAEPLAELGELLSLIEPLATATAVVPGGATPALDPVLERTIQTRVNEAVSSALVSTEQELTALRAAVARLGKRR
jgi:hypothetical protein